MHVPAVCAKPLTLNREPGEQGRTRLNPTPYALHPAPYIPRQALLRTAALPLQDFSDFQVPLQACSRTSKAASEAAKRRYTTNTMISTTATVYLFLPLVSVHLFIVM